MEGRPSGQVMRGLIILGIVVGAVIGFALGLSVTVTGLLMARGAGLGLATGVAAARRRR